MADQNKVGQDDPKFVGTPANPAAFKQSEEPVKEPLYTLTFRENRSFELFVRGERMVFFGGKPNPIFPEEYKDGVPESIVKSEDFKTQARLFDVVKQ